MRRFQADQAQISCKSDQFCVEVSICEAVGGGAI